LMDQRVRALNRRSAGGSGRYVLYWMRWNRRAESNHALAWAADLANHLDVPVLAVETLSCAYPHASDRTHTFALEGVAETAARLRALGAGYVFELQRRREEPLAAVAQLAGDACAAVSDDYPETIAAPSGPDGFLRDLPIACYAVDSSCIVPWRTFATRAYAAFSIRPKIHKLLPGYLRTAPAVRLRRRFSGPAPAMHVEVSPERVAELAAACQIDHSVRPTPSFRGGRAEAVRRLERFLDERLRRYASEKNEPAANATSDLSPYLHWGFLSSLEVALAARERAAEEKLIADEFLEELIVRRELAFNFAGSARRVDNFEELPEWARATLRAHAGDTRDPLYTRERLEGAATADDLWNAAQEELLLRGKIHGYYRMYWGKKILEWSASPEEALATMVYLNDRYALDGQDPNGYANMLWCLGLHDRPWPERPIYGTVRSMSRAGMERKTDARSYVRQMESLVSTGEELNA
jgi:deoxyribodipyrimidine photo-lyase